MDNLTELASLFAERNNIKSYEPCLAKIISKSPIVLKIYDKIFLSSEYNNLKLTQELKDKINNVNNLVNINDDILVIPISNGNMWYAIEKVVNA